MTSKSIPNSVTAEEAVARMINLYYVPAGLTIVEMTAAYWEIAETAYDNARAAHLPIAQTTPLKMQRDACKARHRLAEMLLEALAREMNDKSADSTLVHVKGAGISPRVTLDSAANWAFETFGIDLPDWAQVGQVIDGAASSAKSVPWEQVIIKIYAGYKIGVKAGDAKFKTRSFSELGLMAQRKTAPNAQGALLIALSNKRKFPGSKNVESKHKAAMSRLRRCLEKAHSNPFVLAVGSRALNNIIRKEGRAAGTWLRPSAVTDVNHYLQAEVDMAGFVADIWYRVAPIDGGIEIDLGDESHSPRGRPQSARGPTRG